MVQFRQKAELELQKISQERERIEAAKAAVRQSEANNWLETSRLRTGRSNLENEEAIIKRNQALLDKRELQITKLEDQRRRNRFVL